MGRWIKEASEDKDDVFRGNGKLTSEQLEIRRLKEEVCRLKLEKEILKKATAFFAKDKKKYRVTTDNNPKKPVFENILNRQFQVDEPGG